jgi:hypothetical protein
MTSTEPTTLNLATGDGTAHFVLISHDAGYEMRGLTCGDGVFINFSEMNGHEIENAWTALDHWRQQQRCY